MLRIQTTEWLFGMEMYSFYSSVSPQGGVANNTGGFISSSDGRSPNLTATVYSTCALSKSILPHVQFISDQNDLLEAGHISITKLAHCFQPTDFCCDNWEDICTFYRSMAHVFRNFLRQIRNASSCPQFIIIICKSKNQHRNYQTHAIIIVRTRQRNDNFCLSWCLGYYLMRPQINLTDKFNAI